MSRERPLTKVPASGLRSMHTHHFLSLKPPWRGKQARRLKLVRANMEVAFVLIYMLDSPSGETFEYVFFNDNFSSIS